MGAKANWFGSCTALDGRGMMQNVGSLFIHMIFLYSFLVYSHLLMP